MHRDEAGIPSAAASHAIGKENGTVATLPMKRSDPMTMPRLSGERDSHAVDTHYGVGTSSTLPMEEPVERPVMTPGEAAQSAEMGDAAHQLSAGEIAAVAYDAV
jgi:hypothetical protein